MLEANKRSNNSTFDEVVHFKTLFMHALVNLTTRRLNHDESDRNKDTNAIRYQKKSTANETAGFSTLSLQ